MNELRYSDRALTAKPDYLERRFYYFFSLRLVAWLRPTAITPDTLSLCSFGVGVGGALLLLPGLGYPAHLLAVVLLNLANILDAADGQLARARGEFSAAGWYLDDLYDRVKLILLFAVFSLHLDPPGAWLCFVGLAALFALNFLTEFAAAHSLTNVFRKDDRAGARAPWYPPHAALARLVQFIRETCRVGFITVGELYLLFSLAILFQQYRLGAFIIAGWCLLALTVNSVHAIVKFVYLHRRFNAALRAGERLYVFGAGAGSRDLTRHLQRSGFAVAGILDHDRARAGQTREGLAILHPESLGPEPALILIGSVHQAGIRRQLLARGRTPRDLLVV